MGQRHRGRQPLPPFLGGMQWRSNGVGRVGKVQGPPSSRQKINENNFPVTVKIRISGYQTPECFIATLPT